MTQVPPAEALITVEGRLGRITLNRPERLNALSFGMVHIVLDALASWREDPAVTAVVIDGAGERGLCAGGDIKLLHEGINGNALDPVVFWTDEYRMNLTLSTYPKPIVAVMNGITLGGGVGISGHCRIRVVTETSQVGMPETAIGLSPDVGGLYLLARAPGEVGTHAALTGARFGPADAIWAGLADGFVPVVGVAGVIEELRAGVVPDIAAAASGPGLPPGVLEAHTGWIDECYAGDDAEVIADALLSHADPAAQAAGRTLTGMSPTAVKVTLRALRNAATMTLEEVLQQDLRVGTRFLTHPDLSEGIRAQVIDKDRRPRWNPARLEQVSTADVDEFFASAD